MSKYFETIRLEDGNICYMRYHQNRYEQTLKQYNNATKVCLSEFINPPPQGVFRAKIVYTKEGVESVEYFKYKQRVVGSMKVIESGSLNYNYKYYNRNRLDELFAQRGKCDEVLLCRNTLIQDTTIANVAFFDSKKWYTPKTPLLYGTTRQRYLESGVLVERDITKNELGSFSKMALLNAMVGFKVIALDDKFFC